MYNYKRWVIGGVLGGVVLAMATRISYQACAAEQSGSAASDAEFTHYVAQLLNSLEINYNNDQSLDNLEKVAQANLLRSPKKERWEMEDIWQQKVAQALPILEAMGLTQKVEPQRVSYDYALVMGATTGRMAARLAFLEDLVARKKLEIKKIILLTGARVLDEKIDDITLGKTETDAMKKLYEKSPLALTHTPILLAAQQKQLPDGTTVRPNTDDTVREWLAQEKPTEGSVLVISNQPYVKRQTMVTRRLLPATWHHIEGVGSGAHTDDLSVARMGDEVARTLHEVFLKSKK